MQPLRIDFDIVGLVGRSPHPIHLDSMLAHLKITRDAGINPSPEDVEHALDNLPLERLQIGDDWVWAASSIAFDWAGPPIQISATRAFRAPNIAKHLDVIQGKNEDQQIVVTKSGWKSAQYAMDAQQASHAKAYAVGDLDEISSLLAALETIGARRRHATARITAVRVVPDEAGKEQSLCRYLPVTSGLAVPLREGSYRLPLFARTNQTVIADNHLQWS